MSFILKSSKFVSTFFRCHKQSYIVVAQCEISHLQKKTVLHNSTPAKKFSTLAPRIQETKDINNLSAQLESSNWFRRTITARDVEELIVKLKSCESISDSQALLLLRCCYVLDPVEKPESKINLTKKVWNALENSGATFTAKHYNALLKVYIDNGYNFSPKEFLHEMTARSILPDNITYQRLLKAYCQQGNIEEATNLLESMKKLEFPINEDIFNSLVNGHCQINDVQSAKGIIELMKSRGIAPSSETYYYLLCFYAKKGEMDEIEKILNENGSTIPLLDKDLLNLSYVLAENGHTENMDIVLKRVRGNVGYEISAKEVINRLLHRKLDTAAIKVFSTFKENSSYVKKNVMFNFLVKTRSVNEVFEFCEKLENEEIVPEAVYDGLREILRLRNEPAALNFFRIMKAKNRHLESHFSWPLLITASTEGNHNLLSVWSEMAKIRFPRCSTTFKKVLFPNFKFSSAWNTEIDTFISSGVPETYITSYLLPKFLTTRKIKDAKTLVTTRKISNPNKYIEIMVACLRETRDIDSFVEMLYGFFHDFKVNESTVDTENSIPEYSSDSNVETESSFTYDFDKFVKSIFTELLESLNDESFLLSLLKGMLVKNIGISSETAEMISKKFEQPETTNIIQQLTSSNLQPLIDEKILSCKASLKMNKTLAKAIQDGDLAKALTIWEELKFNPKEEEIFSIVRACIKLNDVQKGMQIFQEFCLENSGNLPKKCKTGLFKMLIKLLIDKEHMEEAKEAFYFARQHGCAMLNDSRFIINGYLQREKFEEATNFFCDVCKKFGKYFGYKHLIQDLMNSQNTECLEKAANAVTEILGESRNFFLLMLYFAEKGHVRQVEKLLETQDIDFSVGALQLECEKYFRLKSTTFFETLMLTTKNFPGMYRQVLFEKLYCLYILEGNFDKAKNLWRELELEENVGCLSLTKEIERFFENEGQFNPSEIEAQKHVETIMRMTNTEVNQKFESDPLIDNVSTISSLDLGVELISKGKVQAFFKLPEIKTTKFLLRICRKLVLKGKIDDYLSFWETALEEPYSFPFFFSDDIIVSFMGNTELMNRFSSFAQSWLEKKKNTTPLTLLATCYMFLPKYWQEAEELVRNHTEVKNGISSRGLLRISNLTNNWNAVKLCVENPIFQQLVAKSLHIFYSRLINHYTEVRDLDSALSYLGQAVSANHGNGLDQNVLSRLASRVQDSGLDFPYHHLLNKEKTETK